MGRSPDFGIPLWTSSSAWRDHKESKNIETQTSWKCHHITFWAFSKRSIPAIRQSDSQSRDQGTETRHQRPLTFFYSWPDSDSICQLLPLGCQTTVLRVGSISSLGFRSVPIQSQHVSNWATNWLISWTNIRSYGTSVIISLNARHQNNSTVKWNWPADWLTAWVPGRTIQDKTEILFAFQTLQSRDY